MSIQELWYRNRIGRGGLGYKYPKGGYGMSGGALDDDNVSLATWAPSYTGQSETDSWIPELTVTGFNPYQTGVTQRGRPVYEEYTPEQMNEFIRLRDMKRLLGREDYDIIREIEKEIGKPLPKKLLKEIPDVNIKALTRGAIKQPKVIVEYTRRRKEEEKRQKERQAKKIELENDIEALTTKINKIVEPLKNKDRKLNEKADNIIINPKTGKQKRMTDKLANEINKINESKAILASSIETNEDLVKLYIELSEKENELTALLAGGPIKEIEPDFFELLLQQEESNNIQLTDEELNELKSLPVIGPLIEKPIEYYDEKRNEYNNAPLFNILSEENISSYAKDKGIENNMAFEQITMQPEVTAKIISLLDSSYEESKIKDIQVINTEIGGEMIDIDGQKVTFNKDKNAPFDLIAIFKYNGVPVKFVIEDKFYNNSGIVTTMKGVQNGRSVKVKYNELMDFTNNEYKKYKEGVISEYNQAKKNYDLYVTEELTDEQIEDVDKEVYDQYHGLRNKIFNDKNSVDNDKLTQEYYRDRYVASIPMKMTKTNFQYPEEKLIESGLTHKEYYKYVHKRGLSTTRKQVNVNDEGMITSISLSGKKDTPYGSNNPGFKLFTGAKILYCVSLQDALLGVNWSDMLKNDPNLVIDPFYKFKPVASAYGHEKGKASTDSIGIPFNTFKVIARHPIQPKEPRQPPVPARQQTTTRQSRILDV
jgi:hypothetical protein